MQEDVLLVRQTLSGDEKAYHRLFIKYQKIIYAQILSMVHSPADAEELTNDVFQKAYQNLSSLRQPDKFCFWIVKIARNHCQNWLQRHKKPFLSLEDVPARELPSTDSAEEELLRQEKYQKVLELIDTLPDVDRELMKGFYFEDASYDTLQKRHGLSKKAVAMRLVKARRKVREKMEKMFSGILVFPWRDVINKLFLGGIEAMKISATTKLVTVWTATLLIVGGITVSVWHTKSSKQVMQKSVATQSAQETPTKSFGHSFSKPKPSVTPVQKPSVSPPVTASEEADKADKEALQAELGEELLETAPSEEINAHLKADADSSESRGDVEREMALIAQQIYDGAEEYRRISFEIANTHQTIEVAERKLQRIYELDGDMPKLAIHYCYLAQNTVPLAPGGWIQDLFADGVMKIELNPVEEGEFIRITTTPARFLPF